MLTEDEQEELESAGFVVSDHDPVDAAASVKYSGSERQLIDALPRGWRALDPTGITDGMTFAMLERVKR